MATERKPMTRKQRIALLIMIALALLMILIGILTLPHPSAATDEPVYNPVGVLFSIGIMCATVVDGRSMAVRDSLSERCQNCARFPGNEQKCAYDTIGRRVVYALDYGCGVWVKRGDITESMLMREPEEKAEEY